MEDRKKTRRPDGRFQASLKTREDILKSKEEELVRQRADFHKEWEAKNEGLRKREEDLHKREAVLDELKADAALGKAVRTYRVEMARLGKDIERKYPSHCGRDIPYSWQETVDWLGPHGRLR